MSVPYNNDDYDGDYDYDDDYDGDYDYGDNNNDDRIELQHISHKKTVSTRKM
jgi:hypothetical protein